MFLHQRSSDSSFRFRDIAIGHFLVVAVAVVGSLRSVWDPPIQCHNLLSWVLRWHHFGCPKVLPWVWGLRSLRDVPGSSALSFQSFVLCVSPVGRFVWIFSKYSPQQTSSLSSSSSSSSMIWKTGFGELDPQKWHEQLSLRCNEILKMNWRGGGEKCVKMIWDQM